MGTFRVALDVGDPQATRWQTVQALADSGSTFTWVPADVLAQLAVAPKARWPFELADGRRIEREVGETQVRLNGETQTTLVIFGDEASEPLLGAYTLEAFRLAVDVVNRRLIPVIPLAK